MFDMVRPFCGRTAALRCPSIEQPKSGENRLEMGFRRLNDSTLVNRAAQRKRHFLTPT
jgi:hypothetical protein